METIEKNIEHIGTRYSIIDEIGKGAMGVVYKAHDTTLDRIVAVKIMRAEINSEFLNQRFSSEMKVVTSLSHQNILPVLDFGKSEDRLYYVTPLIEGNSLDHILHEDSKLTVKQALSTSVAISSALISAHEKGFIHRDVKPSNVMIPKHAGQYNFNQALLMDFGVSGVLQQDSELTSVGQFFGTPVYMSPEQISGKAQSASSDTFGLGVLLFRMIYGFVPFKGNNLASLAFLIMNEPVKIPATPRLPHELRNFIAACLEKDGQKRPANPQQVLERIQTSFAFSAAEDYGEMEDSTSLFDQVFSKKVASNDSKSELPSTGPKAQNQRSAPQNKPRFSKSIYVWGFLFLVGILLPATTYFIVEQPPKNDTPAKNESQIDQPHTVEKEVVYGSLLGLTLVAAGVLVGFWVRTWIRNKKIDLDEGAAQLLSGAKSRIDLSQSLAIEVDELVRKCQAVDERFLGKTLAIMIDDFQQAEKMEDRQKALISAVDILEKLMKKLSPWYVRKEKLIALAVSSIGITLGIIKIYESVSG